MSRPNDLAQSEAFFHAVAWSVQQNPENRSAAEREDVQRVLVLLEPVCVHFARKLPAPLAETLPVALLGVYNALTTFDPTRGARFVTFAVWEIRSSLSTLRNRRKFGAPVSLDSEDVRGGTLADHLPQLTATMFTETELRLDLERELARLPARERAAVECFIYEGLTFAEIGALMGLGRSRARQIVTAAIAQIRPRLSI